MSALGQKPTFYVAVQESALPPKADIGAAAQYVRLVPIADIQLLGKGELLSDLHEIRFFKPGVGPEVSVDSPRPTRLLNEFAILSGDIHLPECFVIVAHTHVDLCPRQRVDILLGSPHSYALKYSLGIGGLP